MGTRDAARRWAAVSIAPAMRVMLCVGRSRETLDCFRSEQPVNRGCVYKSIIVYKCPVGERSLCCVRRAACIVGFVLYEKNVHQPWPWPLNTEALRLGV